MKKVGTTIVLLLSSVACFAQANSVVPQVIRATNVLENFQQYSMNPTSMMQLMPMDKPRTVGDSYLNSTWNRTAFMLYGSDNLVEGYMTKYDLAANELDIFNPMGIKTIKSDNIKSFVWVDSLTGQSSYFVNGMDYLNEEGVPIVGVLQVVSDGSFPLFKKTEATVLESNYNMTLNVGRRDNEISKKEVFYYLEGKTLHKIPGNIKKVAKLFGDKTPEMEAFIKLNNLKADREHHLLALFDHYAGLSK